MREHTMEAGEAPRRRGEVVRGTYVIGEVLGVGGMGIVYAAVHRALDRTVAFKVPRPELGEDPTVRWQFQMEALAGARIKHRNVVGVVDFGRCAGVPFLVTEHVAGPRLGEVVLEQGPLALPIAVGLVRQILDGLADVHALGIVHGDIKCDNVLVETLRDGSMLPRVIDFGLARFVAQPPPPVSVIAGTPDYLAPEIIEGEPLSFASDVYAMGVMCYELVTGGSPFGGGTSAQIMQRQIDDIAAPMSCRCPGVPAALDDLVARALAKAPEDRFANATAMARAFDAIEVDLQPSLRAAAVGCPVLCSTETTTSPMSIVDGKVIPRGGAGTHEPPRSRVEQRRRDIVAALQGADVDAVVLAYLELARALIDEHELAGAISELEEGIELLGQAREGKKPGQIWRLQLTLAALYDGRGDRVRACTAMRAAHQQAQRLGSAIGQQRAKELFVRLVRRRESHNGRSRAW